ncbi:MAG: TIGR01621 family pseudouridine synthase [Bacteriovoracaceae bacterium]|jgi:tRNA pseudouridine32 synthase/23S rRNA pseudouridine746 synthase|nr:TIGR01621 family pseudouridine synthase [Bacteriovoracaceae bacterium]
MKVLLDHPHFLAIYKPCGISFHSEVEEGFFAQVLKQSKKKLYSIHRLDKVTSGIVLIAKDQNSASKLSYLFASKVILKTYIALSDQRPKKKQGIITGDMVKSRRMQYKLLRSKNNPAITRFESELIEPGLRLYKLYPKTGKTHQLRVALKSVGAPILGDTLYSGTSSDRTYLHAYKIEFNYEGESICIKCLPESGQLFKKIDFNLL